MEADTRTDAEKAADAAKAAPSNVPLEVKEPVLDMAETRRRSEEDRAAEDRRGDGRHTNNPNAPAAVARQHQEVDDKNERRNELNRPGHERNMERVEAEAGEAQARTHHADDHRANHTPTGKQTNRNTPRIDEDGTKHWDQ